MQLSGPDVCVAFHVSLVRLGLKVEERITWEVVKISVWLFTTNVFKKKSHIFYRFVFSLHENLVI